MMNNRKLYKGLISAIAFLSLVFASQGCDTTETTGSQISLSFFQGSGTQKINTDIQLTEVKILLRDIKL